ncbi:hypothetical protein [Nocardia wallacei]|uniref:hypothetical protein n=1 Tax=Nocardia wallacei TaxID=480035 RepID=UPI00245424FB|nr:hypothetical protein [Nocardia wallacei]
MPPADGVLEDKLGNRSFGEVEQAAGADRRVVFGALPTGIVTATIIDRITPKLN